MTVPSRSLPSLAEDLENLKGVREKMMRIIILPLYFIRSTTESSWLT
jgi:hypothetical protein